MMYIYCPRSSTTAFELVRELEATRLRKFDGLDFWSKGKRLSPEEGSTIVCWGATLPEIDGLRILNSLDTHLNRHQQIQKLIAARIPAQRTILPDGFHTIESYIEAGYQPRLFYGEVNPFSPNKVEKADYFVQNDVFAKEFRVHSFAGRSIKAGRKVAREGFASCRIESWKPDSNLLHPSVRTYEGGWRVSYDGFVSTPQMRDTAHKTIKLLGLTFGIVDLGQRVDGTLVVTDVLTATKLDSTTTQAYVRAIQRWIKKEEAEGD